MIVAISRWVSLSPPSHDRMMRMRSSSFVPNDLPAFGLTPSGRPG